MLYDGMKGRWRLVFQFMLCCCSSPGPAFGWGSEGHRAIAALAAQLISPETRAHVQKRLAEGGDTDLAAVSTWADELVEARVGSGPLRNNPEAQLFNRQFPDNPKWHFTNLPLGLRDYSEAGGFAAANDVVHAIERCITVLESANPVSGEIGQTQALRLLVHFVGDVHQPLHCGSGFYELRDPERPELITDPKAAFGLPNDRGGNDLFYGPEKQLHAFWDVELVERIADSPDYQVLAGYLAKTYPPEAVPLPPGHYHHWPELWAIESVAAANLAYAGIEFQAAKRSVNGELLQVTIGLPAGYEQRSKAVAAQQLARAGAHLAQLLDRIKWRCSKPEGR